MVEFAISVPQVYPDGTFDREALRAYLIRAEDLGFSGAWVTEQVVGTAPNLDPSVLLALTAAYTSRVRLGCAVYVSTLASPLTWPRPSRPSIKSVAAGSRSGSAPAAASGRSVLLGWTARGS